jgi:hypothetical protein
MAKKAKKAKKVSKAKKTKRASAKRKTVSVQAESVVQFVKMLIKEGRDEDFENRAKKSKVVVKLTGDGADFVRKFLARNKQLRGPMTMAIREPCPGNPFEC